MLSRSRLGEEIDRTDWNALCPSGDPLDCTVSVRPTSVSIESDGGMAEIAVYVREDGVDLRMRRLQFIVKGERVTVLRQEGAYPIQRWTVLWEGRLP